MDNIPNHVAIILDGNGRWAKERHLTRSQGHVAGYENLLNISKHILKRGVKYFSVYAFSTENFKRSADEVNFLMNLFVDKFNQEFEMYKDEDIKVVFSGRRSNLRKDLLEAMDKITLETKDGVNGVFNICLNYGSQFEIVDACNQIIKDGVKEVTVETFNSYLYQDLPPVDLMIRTSGEQRLSNFMLWQCAYAEMYFPNIYFPDFDADEFDKAIDIYNKRDRRFGGIKDENKTN